MKRGRFNVVDIVVVLIVVLALLFLGKKFLPHTAAPTAPATSMKAVFVSNPIPIWTPLMSRLHSGATVQAVLGGTAYPFGTLQAAQLQPDMIVAPDAQGNVHVQPDPLFRQIQLTVSVKASAGKTGYTVNGNPVYVGQTIVVEAGTVQLTGYMKTLTP